MAHWNERSESVTKRFDLNCYGKRARARAKQDWKESQVRLWNYRVRGRRRENEMIHRIGTRAKGITTDTERVDSHVKQSVRASATRHVRD